MKGFAYLVFPNSALSVAPKGSFAVEDEPVEHGVITSVTQGAMAGSSSLPIVAFLISEHS